PVPDVSVTFTATTAVSGASLATPLPSGMTNAAGVATVSGFMANFFASGGGYTVTAHVGAVASTPVTLSNTLAPFTPNYTDLQGVVSQIATTTDASNQNTLTIFGIGGDGAIWYRQETPGNDPTSFGPWTSLGGFAKGLAVTPQGAGLPPAVFVIG